MAEDRYDRQRRLREVGAAGQLRIERSQAHIPAGPGASVCLAYLARAGVERATIAVGAADFPRHAAFFRYSGPLVVAHGAEFALRHLLSSLELA